VTAPPIVGIVPAPGLRRQHDHQECHPRRCDDGGGDRLCRCGGTGRRVRSDDKERQGSDRQVDPAAKGGDNPAALCAAFAEGLGLIKSLRVVVDECLDEGDNRTQTLSGLDRSIRQLQTQVDKNCE
jgi:hypothetical protein